MLASSPASILNHKINRTGIPQDSVNLGNALSRDPPPDALRPDRRQVERQGRGAILAIVAVVALTVVINPAPAGGRVPGEAIA